MKIYGTPTSPYTRMVRIAALEFGIPATFHIMRWRETPTELFEINPVGRIPILFDGDRRLVDSRVIWNYLQAHPDANAGPSLRLLDGAARWDEENLVSLAYAMADSRMVLRGMGEEPPVDEHPYLDRNQNRIELCLTTLEQAAAPGYLIEPETFGIADAALIAVSKTLIGRKITDIADYPNIAAIRARHAERPSIIETRPEY